MHRIDTAGNVNGLFNNGNPQTGQLATRLSSDWFNDVQENLLTVLDQAGIVPQKNEFDQLYQAIVSIIETSGGGGTVQQGGGVPITRRVNAAGLAAGGGALANDVTVTVPKATSADVAAGTNDTKAVTPLALREGGSLVAAMTGYAKFQNGLIIQWGSATLGALGSDQTVVVTLPTTFPSMCFYAGLGRRSIPDSYVSGVGVSAITIFKQAGASASVGWLAIGA